MRNAGQSAVADQALVQIAAIYRIEREMAELDAQDRQQERQRVPDGSATAKALDYSLDSWQALTRNLLGAQVKVDNNSLENLLRPWAMGRKAWLFVGSELAGQRAAIVMSLVHSARLHGRTTPTPGCVTCSIGCPHT